MAFRLITVAKSFSVAFSLLLICSVIYQWISYKGHIDETDVRDPVSRGTTLDRREGALHARTEPANSSLEDQSPTSLSGDLIDNEKWLAEMKNIQSKRLEHKRTVCASSFHTRTSLNVPWKGSFDLTYSNDDHKLIVSTVWKVGASHWKRVMRILHDNGSSEFRKRQPDPHTAMSKMRDFDKKFREYFKVLFVRHPFSRLVSAYRDKVSGTKIPYYRNKAKRMVKAIRRGASKLEIEEGNATFLEFTKWLVQGGDSDLHWYPINLKYHPCRIPYDFIGKIETINDDTTYLFKLLKVDGIVSYPGAYNHTMSGDETLLRQYYRDIPNDIIIKLAKKYDADFRIFGYRIPKNNSDFINAVDLQGL